MKRYILFDLDGTLTDPMVGITSSVKYALEKFDIHVDSLEELTPFIGPPLIDSFMKYYGMDKEQAKLGVKYYREYFSPTGLYQNEIYPDTEKMLKTLTEAGFEVVLATSKPTVFAKRILEYFNIDRYFSFISGAELTEKRNQKWEVIQYALDQLSIKPSEAIMVGDRLHDMQGAKTCLVQAVGVTYGYGSREELRNAGADQIFDTINELTDYILKTQYESVQGLKEENMYPPEKTADAVRIGIIGTTAAADRFYLGNRYGMASEITAIYDKDKEALEAFVYHKGRLHVFDDFEDFIRSDTFDAVYIATAPETHYDLIMKCIEAHKHVLCMSPLALTYQDGMGLYQAADDKEVILMEAFETLFTPSYEQMRMVGERLGDVKQVTLMACRKNKEVDGLSQAGTAIAAMLDIFGKPEDVFCMKDDDQIGTILFKYPGLIGQVVYSSATDSIMPSQFQGTDGSMLVEEIDNVKDIRLRVDGVRQSVRFEQSDNISGPVGKAFVYAIIKGTGWEWVRDLSLMTLQIADVIRKGHEEN